MMAFHFLRDHADKLQAKLCEVQREANALARLAREVFEDGAPLKFKDADGKTNLGTYEGLCGEWGEKVALAVGRELREFDLRAVLNWNSDLADAPPVTYGRGRRETVTEGVR